MIIKSDFVFTLNFITINILQASESDDCTKMVSERSRSVVRLSDPDCCSQNGSQAAEEQHKLIERCASENNAHAQDKDYSLAENINW
jgi:hypothetical protein